MRSATATLSLASKTRARLKTPFRRQPLKHPGHRAREKIEKKHTRTHTMKENGPQKKSSSLRARASTSTAMITREKSELAPPARLDENFPPQTPRANPDNSWHAITLILTKISSLVARNHRKKSKREMPDGQRAMPTPPTLRPRRVCQLPSACPLTCHCVYRKKLHASATA